MRRGLFLVIVSIFAIIILSIVPFVIIQVDSQSSINYTDRIEITDLQDLQEMQMDLDSNYILVADIDASSTKTWNSGHGFLPIGNYSSKFTGSLDGNGHTIKSLFINNSDHEHAGLFGFIDDSGSVKDLILDNFEIFGGFMVGSLAGASNGSVSSVEFSCKISGTHLVGGLLGLNYGSINNSHGTGNIKGDDIDPTGGSVGMNMGRISNSSFTGKVVGGRAGGLTGMNNGLISYSDAIVEVVGKGYSAGGLVGGNNIGSIFRSSSSGNVTSINDNIGGLAGVNKGQIEESFSETEVKGKDTIGGLVGRNYYDSIVNNSYSTGNVKGEQYVGGLIGLLFEDSISRVYSTGEVEGIQDSGGLVGYMVNEEEKKDCFWDSDVSKISESACGISKSTGEMKKRETFINASWDFENVWYIDDGTTYPHLIWDDVILPIARIEPLKDIEIGETITLDGDSSNDNVGIKNFTWTIRSDNTSIHLYGEKTTFKFSTSGEYSITLSVTDGAGNSDEEQLSVTVSEEKNNFPAIIIAIITILSLITIVTLIIVIMKISSNKNKEFQNNENKVDI